MPTTTPLTDAIQALTTYANETTGASDTTLSAAVGTLVAGYGQGGSGWTTDGIATNAEPSGALVLGNVEVKNGAFCCKTGITSVSGQATAVLDSAFLGCSGLTSAMFPNITGQVQQSSFKDCKNLEIADLGSCYQINSSAFQNDNKLVTVILRRSSVVALQTVSAFLNTGIRGYGGRSGTIYVPNSLIASYQTANNWSSIYAEGHVTFAKIEGSIYE